MKAKVHIKTSLLDKLEKIHELCPYCNQEVELENKLEPQKCPNCKRIIMPCSICDYRLAETSNHEECKQCERDCISREMNKQIKLTLSIDEAKLLHNGATEEKKLELEELYPELKPNSIIDRVKTYVDALKVLKKDHFDENNLYPREIARRKLEVIIEALNEGWKLDFDNYEQDKWYCYFYGAHAGFGYSYSSNSFAFALTITGIRLCLKSKELADYVGTQFRYLYEEMLLG